MEIAGLPSTAMYDQAPAQHGQRIPQPAFSVTEVLIGSPPAWRFGW